MMNQKNIGDITSSISSVLRKPPRRFAGEESNPFHKENEKILKNQKEKEGGFGLENSHFEGFG